MAGYASGFLGPLGVGADLDLAGNGALGWGLAFGHVAVVTLVGFAALRRLRMAVCQKLPLRTLLRPSSLAVWRVSAALAR